MGSGGLPALVSVQAGSFTGTTEDNTLQAGWESAAGFGAPTVIHRATSCEADGGKKLAKVSKAQGGRAKDRGSPQIYPQKLW